jgi:hypothetical protein
VVSKLGDGLDKLGGFRGRDPFQPQPVLLEPRKSKELLHHCQTLGGHVITVQVMAVTDVSATHEDTVRTLLKSLQKMVG